MIATTPPSSATRGVTAPKARNEILRLEAHVRLSPLAASVCRPIANGTALLASNDGSPAFERVSPCCCQRCRVRSSAKAGGSS